MKVKCQVSYVVGKNCICGNDEGVTVTSQPSRTANSTMFESQTAMKRAAQ